MRVSRKYVSESNYLSLVVPIGGKGKRIDAISSVIGCCSRSGCNGKVCRLGFPARSYPYLENMSSHFIGYGDHRALIRVSVFNSMDSCWKLPIRECRRTLGLDTL